MLSHINLIKYSKNLIDCSIKHILELFMVSNIQTRAKILNQENINNGKYVLYWMQASQRVEYNHALEYGIYKANKINKPLVVFLE